MKRIAVWIIGLAVVVAGLVLVRPGWLGLSSKPEAVISSTPRVMYGPVKLGGKWGFIGTTGKILIDPQFDGAHRFDKGSGLAAVKLGGKWGYIDRTGKIVISPQFDESWGFDKNSVIAE